MHQWYTTENRNLQSLEWNHATREFKNSAFMIWYAINVKLKYKHSRYKKIPKYSTEHFKNTRIFLKISTILIINLWISHIYLLICEISKLTMHNMYVCFDANIFLQVSFKPFWYCFNFYERQQIYFSNQWNAQFNRKWKMDFHFLLSMNRSTWRGLFMTDW